MKSNVTVFVLAVLAATISGCRTMPTWDWWRTSRVDRGDSTPIARSAPELPSQIAARTEGGDDSTAPAFTPGVQITIPETDPSTADGPYASTGYPATDAAGIASGAGIGSLVPPKVAVTTPVANADITTGSDGSNPSVSITPIAPAGVPYPTQPPASVAASVPSSAPQSPVQLSPVDMQPRAGGDQFASQPPASGLPQVQPGNTGASPGRAPLPRVSLPPLSPRVASTQADPAVTTNTTPQGPETPSVSIPPITPVVPQATSPVAVSVPPLPGAATALPAKEDAAASPSAVASPVVGRVDRVAVAATGGRRPYRPGGTSDFKKASAVSVATRPGAASSGQGQILPSVPAVPPSGNRFQ